MIGITLVRCVAMLMRSLPDRCENSTAKTVPVGPTTSATCETEVPLAAPRYRTFAPGFMYISSRPPNIPAASFDLRFDEWGPQI